MSCSEHAACACVEPLGHAAFRDRVRPEAATARLRNGRSRVPERSWNAQPPSPGNLTVSLSRTWTAALDLDHQVAREEPEPLNRAALAGRAGRTARPGPASAALEVVRGRRRLRPSPHHLHSSPAPARGAVPETPGSAQISALASAARSASGAIL